MKTKASRPMTEERPRTQNGTVPPKRQRNEDRRPREHLTPKEVDRLIAGARKHNRYGHRDASAILICYRHGFRVSELCRLRWDDIDFASGTIFVRRLKGSVPSTQPLGGREIRALRRVKRENPASPYVFMSERKAPLTPAGFRKMIARLGGHLKFPFPIHPHMLRHGTGYDHQSKGRDTRTVQYIMGHKNIQHTARYTAIDTETLRGFWED